MTTAARVGALDYPEIFFIGIFLPSMSQHDHRAWQESLVASHGL